MRVALVTCLSLGRRRDEEAERLLSSSFTSIEKDLSASEGNCGTKEAVGEATPPLNREIQEEEEAEEEKDEEDEQIISSQRERKKSNRLIPSL